jgi:hypothetical protein
MMAPMPTFTASRRAVVATALGLAMSLSLVGCSRADAPSEMVGCTLLWYDGYLVADNGRVFLTETQGARPGSGTPLDWPDDWTVRPTDDGQLEIVDGWGTVRARTGAGIVLSAVGGNDPPGTALFRDGEMVVCPDQWPDNYMDPDYVAPD